MAKYRNKKVIIDGIVFDSKKEAMRWKELCLLEKAGTIRNLQRQVEYVLIPAQYGITGYTKTGKPITKCIERAVKYVADFQYIEGDQFIVEDTKGFRTKDYILKRKMLLYFHGIRVKEI